MKITLLILGIALLIVFSVRAGYDIGSKNQSTRDEAVRQELLHQLDKFYFGICYDIKDSGDMKLYNRDCL